MTYLLVAIASVFSGVICGFTGLSSAAVTVPLLITFCPEFQGEYGVFMAVAISLFGDIVGNAVRLFIFKQKKSVDIKSSPLMLIPLVLLAAGGSVLSFFIHQEVLGIICVAAFALIGLRFLIKPEPYEVNSIRKFNISSFRLMTSLAVGIVVGMGIGLFGSGCVMIIFLFSRVFYFDKDKSFGSASFFTLVTSLAALATHIIMVPAIITSLWPFMLMVGGIVGVVTFITTKVKDKINITIFGYVLGYTLIILSGAMTLVHYYPNFEQKYVLEFIKVFLWFVVPVAVLTVVYITIRYFVRIPDYIFRKVMHLTAISTVMPLVFSTSIWWISEIAIGFFGIGIVLILIVFEKISFYKKLFVEKERHEVMFSFAIFFAVMAALVALFWWYKGDANKYLVIIAILAWGVGDAAAAIFGHMLGKHKVSGRFIEGVKSIEGSAFCFAFSFVITFGLLLVFFNAVVIWALITEAFLVALAVTLFELFTKKGFDNLTCPLAAAFILFAFLFI